MSTALTRPRNGKVIAGVCAAIANRLGVSPWLVRACFVISCALPGPQFIVYLLGWVLIPKQG
jgi:phage shock protein C